MSQITHLPLRAITDLESCRANIETVYNELQKFQHDMIGQDAISVSDPEIVVPTALDLMRLIEQKLFGFVHMVTFSQRHMLHFRDFKQKIVGGFVKAMQADLKMQNSISRARPDNDLIRWFPFEHQWQIMWVTNSRNNIHTIT